MLDDVSTAWAQNIAPVPAGTASSQAGEGFPALKQCLAVLGGEVPGSSVAQTITECLRWMKLTVR